MTGEGEREAPQLLLGQSTPVVTRYAPEWLYPIPRAQGRAELGLHGALPFHGADLWHAYELSWLDDSGRPRMAVGRLTVPADSPNLVESKSLKLYLNSLYNTRFADAEGLAATVSRDIAAVAGAEVSLQLLAPNDPLLGSPPDLGQCLDTLEVTPPEGEPAAQLLASQSKGAAEDTGAVPEIEEQLHSHLLRSLCPVTGQPDWATLWVRYRGRPIDHESLLRYLLAYRDHREFHEQCVERIYCDIRARCEPSLLQVQGFYTRRGGLDINPFRSSQPGATPLPRLPRQ